METKRKTQLLKGGGGGLCVLPASVKVKQMVEEIILEK